MLTRVEFVELLKDAMRSGMRREEIAAAGGVSESSIRHWIERRKAPRNPMVRAAIAKFIVERLAAKEVR